MQRIHVNSLMKGYTGERLESNSGVSVPMELVCATLPACGGVHQLRSSVNRILWGFMETSSHLRARLLTPFLAPLPLQRMGSGAESSKLHIMAGLCGDHPHPGASKNCLIVTKDTITQPIPRHSGSLRQTLLLLKFLQRS